MRAALSLLFLGLILVTIHGQPPKSADGPIEFARDIRPLLQKYCLDCHSTKMKKGSLDLERFGSLADIRQDTKPWQGMIEQIEAGEMPPKERPQPTAEEKKKLLGWVKGFLDAEARANKGDPGHVPLRRLSNAEYDYTIRDLTGIDLRPTREFPADGAAGEGFTNAAEALTDISPALLTKYLNAAKDVADHAVLIPDGVRFSSGKTRRDWTDESTARLRTFYAAFTPDGKLNLQPYLAATVRHRDALVSGQATLEGIAAKEKLNAKYLSVLWKSLTDKSPSFPLDAIRLRWQRSSERDVAALVAEVAGLQAALWSSQPIGSYRYGAVERQIANDPAASAVQTLKFAMKPAPGQSDIVIHLASRELLDEGKGNVIWQRPRFEAAGQPALLLADYARFGPKFEVDYAALFSDTAKYLAAAADSKTSIEERAKANNLDPAFLKRWVEVLALQPPAKDSDEFTRPLRTIPAGALTVLEERLPRDPAQRAINGWHKKGTDLPVAVSNSSDKTEKIPGTVRPHAIAVHPMPQEYVAAAWTSPVQTSVKITATITHAHPACGNGVAYRIEHRHGQLAGILAEGAVDLGKEATAPAVTAKVDKGDIVLLVVDARDGSHVCDMTEIAFTIVETDQGGRKWDLSKDVADTILDGNPHADSLGHKDVWSFVRGASIAGGSPKNGPTIPPNSILGKWRAVALDPTKRGVAEKLADQVQKLLAGPRPGNEKSPERALYDNLAFTGSTLLQGLDLSRLGKPRNGIFGLAKDRFANGNIVAAAGSAVEVRLPAALFHEREFVVDGKLDGAADRVVQFQIRTGAAGSWDARSPVVASPNGNAYKQLLAGYAEFRRLFPPFVCYQQVIPTDEVVSLKMFHREDEPLRRLFLSDEQTKQIDRLWSEHRFISRQAIAENDYLPQFIGYVTQDQPKQLLDYFESQRPVFRKRAEQFEKELEAAIPRQLDSLLEFAGKAYRRPLSEPEKGDLRALYQAIRNKGTTHEEAFRGVLSRVLVSPAFLFRIEQRAAGKAPAPVSDWELATRLSYFLWASVPDDELRVLAAAGKLRDPKVLAAQTSRMLKDSRTRALAIEFGTQWIHVRGFDAFNEKNEKLFPTFDARLRAAIYEESILFFQDLFGSDRPVTAILDADYTFLNEVLAKHYGIADVTGPEFRKVDGVRKYGRGGILGFASVQSKQSGASRTSPVLRGNWVVETLLGEKLPKPPPNVPRLPEEEGAGNLTTRQQVEKHARDPACAVCHVRIDPFGFALEKYDTIGRFREKDLGGLAVDTKSRLKDGTEFDGIDGLRNYLLTRKKDVIVRLYCRKLLGYALGRAVTLSDTALVDEMVAELKGNEGRVSAAVLAIVRSPQFRMIRGEGE
jgi:hypothetical protein